jgi:sialate O-acetylesterase
MFSSSMVLQRAPSKSAVYGHLGAPSVTKAAAASIQVTVDGVSEGGQHALYTVAAEINADARTWKAFLKPSEQGGNYTIKAACTSGCTGSASINDTTFGDVWMCTGQSNMWLPMYHSFTRNKSLQAIMNGTYDNIRLMAGDSQDSATSAPWMHVRHAATVGASTSSFNHYPNVLFKFSAACYYFAQSVTDLLRERYNNTGKPPPVFGLVGTAIGGSM